MLAKAQPARLFSHQTTSACSDSSPGSVSQQTDPGCIRVIEVAEKPDELIVYGGIGKAARNWECYDAIVATLKRLSREAEAVLASSVPGLVDIRSSLQTGHPEIQVVYNRDRLAEYGLNLRSVVSQCAWPRRTASPIRSR